MAVPFAAAGEPLIYVLERTLEIAEVAGVAVVDSAVSVKVMVLKI